METTADGGSAAVDRTATPIRRAGGGSDRQVAPAVAMAAATRAGGLIALKATARRASAGAPTSATAAQDEGTQAGPARLSGQTDSFAAARRRAAASRTAQGLPAHVEDVAVLARVAALLATSVTPQRTRAGR